MVIPKIQQNRLTEILFTIYLVVLVWVVLFKMCFSIHHLPTVQSLNFVPFAQTAVIDGQLDYSEIIGNILIFVPFGMYLSMLNPSWAVSMRVLMMVSTSLFFEISQYVLAIGGTDITDILGNTLGGVIGIGLFMVLQQLFKDSTLRMFNLLACIGTASALTFLTVLLMNS